ncbi:DUF1707 domain-containing protein [Nocardioides sp.]|uniref:DUF1707 SHOCT-like domain-containing protein n=1 Tax=Nocardioides sp. TaxID=35761 RepID=UPI001A2607BA|nr:DUF1707 domain-containing protein [Nocardioides sp.]MBJ7358072.1 DUF1707 domain-containing protein [Nocardioides sp.]
MEGEVWGAFGHDPRDPAVASLRASDADREVIHGVLAEAFADGRLDRAEYDERSTSVLAARTLGELPPVVADLVPSLPVRTSSGRVPLVAATPGDIQRRAEEKWRDDRRNAFFGFVGPTVVCWTIWFAVGWEEGTFHGGFPWPAIVMAVTFLNLLKTATSRGPIVASEVRRLEEKQAKALEKKQRDQ